MKLFLVGGFLGSGKTTAIHQAAASFLKRVKRVAVITNDQGDELVDTHFVKTAGVKTEEVTNGCFCCNFSQFVQAIELLRSGREPDIIFAESVGSCADLVATIAKPLGKFNPEITVVISVFADAQLLHSLITGNASFLDENVRYIYKKQLEEADVLIVNKVDLMTGAELKIVKEQIEADYSETTVLYQNSLDENSVRNWILQLNRFELKNERKSLEIDYDLYAKGEAILGWLDQKIKIKTKDYSAHSVAVNFITAVYSGIKQTDNPVAHLKFLLDDGVKQHKISFTTLDDISKEFLLVDNEVNEILILMNARIQTEAIKLEKLVSDILQEIRKQTGSEITIEKKAAFQPGYPRPTHRIA
ncbi:MAG TPA: GTP-binding protein [Flavitalea sp.]|nr:GTP-binding protein [Flavitalea sp.]